MASANPLGDDHLYAASSKGRMKVLAATANPLGNPIFEVPKPSGVAILLRAL